MHLIGEENNHKSCNMLTFNHQTEQNYNRLAKMKKKTIHTVESLLARTEEVGNCIEWQGYFENHSPYVQHGDRFMNVRALLMELLGNKYEGRMFYGNSCDNKACVNPEHIVARSMKDHAKHMVKKVEYKAPIRIAKLQKSAQGRRVLTDDQVMQALMDPRRCEDIATEFGVSKSLIARIKRGESNQMAIAKNNPFWGLMA